MISCYIIDDDPRSIEIIEEYLQPLSYIEIVFRSDDPTKLIEQIPGFPEKALIILDIDLPTINGLDLAEMFPSQTAVVFSTAHTEFAYKAFDLDAIDYLIKPYDQKRFYKSITKVTKRFHAPILQNQEEDYIYLNINKNLKKVYYSDIYYLESMENYINVFTSDQKITIHQSLKSILAQLPDHVFLQISRFYIVNMKKVKNLTLRKLELETGKTFKLSPHFKSKITNLFQQLRNQS
jgi:DNA-binding LytR/AlgR family response regulator